jgi:hypothetical protein
VTPRSPHDVVPSPDNGDARAGTTDNTTPAAREHAPWRPVGVGVATSLGTAGVGVLHPVLGAAAAIVELGVALTIIATALFGSQALSDRAFRLLRWIGNRPEPRSPDGPAEARTGG